MVEEEDDVNVEIEADTGQTAGKTKRCTDRVDGVWLEIEKNTINSSQNNSTLIEFRLLSYKCKQTDIKWPDKAF